MAGPAAPKRIVLVTTSFPRKCGDPSGHFVATEALRLQQAGHHVIVLAPGDDREAPSSYVQVVGLGAVSLFGWPGALPRLRERPARLARLPGFLARARRELAHHGPFDRAILHFLVPCGWPLGLFAGASDVEIVCHGSDVRLLLGVPGPLRARIIASLLRRGAGFRFVSRELRDSLVEGLPPPLARTLEEQSRVELPALGLPDLAEIQRRARELRALWATGEAPVFVSCARLIRAKRVDLAIEEAHRRGAILIVVGEGPERARLIAYAKALGARARFLGKLPRGEALSSIAAADRLVHMSEAEGAPTVIREARALGVPVLARPVGDVAMWAAQDPDIELFVDAPAR